MMPASHFPFWLQEVQQQLQEAQQALRQEKKKREAAERRARKASDEVSEVQVWLGPNFLLLVKLPRQAAGLQSAASTTCE